MPRPPILPQIKWPAVFKSGQTYRQWLAQAEDKANAKLMEKLRKELKLEAGIIARVKALARPLHVVAIAEDWCGDVHRHVPVLEKLAAANRRIRVRYVSREQHPEVFKRFLTNGGEAIPKFVFLSDKFVECGNWGPMPEECRRLISRGKAAGDVGAARKRVGAMYESDPNREVVISELLALMETATCELP